MTNSDFIALCAAGIAVLALVATIWQGAISRRHNRLSVRPHLDTHETLISGGTLSLSLANSGLGPAIIKRVRITIEGEIHTDFGSAYRLAVAKAVIGFEGKGDMQVAEPGSVLTAGQKLELFSISFDTESDQKLLAAKKFIDSYALEVTYESMYGEEFSVVREAKR
ncbi:MAG: hypothetical protein KF892_24385 [Rhizobacter sp.]|nr:hypothetical protein [Rhizobacter sp.]